MTVDDLEQQRETLREQVESGEAELRQAVEDLKEAVGRPLRVLQRLQENPLPWLLAGALVGVWLGSMNGADNNER